MEVFTFPQRRIWEQLCQRPTFNHEEIFSVVSEILNDVKHNGDEALRIYTKQFDNANIENFKVSDQEISNAENQISNELKEAIALAYHNIYTYHNAQKIQTKEISTQPGVRCWQKTVPIQTVGLYIPGGSAPLFSSILMLGIPANIAGCKQVNLCTPPQSDGSIHPAILYSAKIVGIDNIYKVGGAQAIGAMSYGTESIPAVQKIFGPGNQFVTTAKQIVQQEQVAIDMPAGPSEVLLITNENSKPEFVAADLLSQAEHGPDSQVILLSTSEKFVNSCQKEVHNQIQNLPRKSIAEKALSHSKIIVLHSLEESFEFSNVYAPEHLILGFDQAEKYIDLIENAGSVFIGPYSSESAGDYASGPNHTLPTNAWAKSLSGVSLHSFLKSISFQEVNKEGLLSIGPAVEVMANAEGLQAHKEAISVRLKSLES